MLYVEVLAQKKIYKSKPVCVVFKVTGTEKKLFLYESIRLSDHEMGRGLLKVSRVLRQRMVRCLHSLPVFFEFSRNFPLGKFQNFVIGWPTAAY